MQRAGLSLLLLAIVAVWGWIFVQTLVQQKISAVQTSLMIVAEPLFAAWFGDRLAGDRLTTLQMSGGGLMFAAMVVVSLLPSGRAACRFSRNPNPTHQ